MSDPVMKEVVNAEMAFTEDEIMRRQYAQREKPCGITAVIWPRPDVKVYWKGDVRESKKGDVRGSKKGEVKKRFLLLSTCCGWG